MGYTEKGSLYIPETPGKAAAAVMAAQRWQEEQARKKAEKAAQSLGGRVRRLAEKVKKELW